MSKYITELIGTFFLVLTIALTVAADTPFAPLAIGNYNPAVTLGVLLRGRLEGGDAARYMIYQVVGALLAALVSYLLVGGTFAPEPAGGIFQALVAETLFTFALVLVVLDTATADETAGNSYFGLAIGFTVMAGAFAVGEISGAAFNPAVGVGAILVNGFVGSGSMGDIWIYLVGPFAGGALAAVVFKLQHPVRPAIEQSA